MKPCKTFHSYNDLKKKVLIDLQALKVHKNIALKNSTFSSFHKLI